MAESSDLPQKRLEWIFGYNNMQGDISQNSIEGNKTVVGVEFMYNNIDQEVYGLGNSLTYNAKDETMLAMLWQYDEVTILYTLQHLARMVSANDKIAAFFAKLHGPTYQWARYTDWFKPEWEEYLAKKQNNLNLI